MKNKRSCYNIDLKHVWEDIKGRKSKIKKKSLTLVISKAKLQSNKDIMAENDHKGLMLLLEYKSLTKPYNLFIPMLKQNEKRWHYDNYQKVTEFRRKNREMSKTLTSLWAVIMIPSGKHNFDSTCN